jgi:hypothetical protein
VEIWIMPPARTAEATKPMILALNFTIGNTHSNGAILVGIDFGARGFNQGQSGKAQCKTTEQAEEKVRTNKAQDAFHNFCSF